MAISTLYNGSSRIGLLYSASPLSNEFGPASPLPHTSRQLSGNDRLRRTILRRRVYDVYQLMVL
jgi:hypothetical protein